MADGRIIIETDLETKSVDAQIKELESKLETMTKTLESDAVVDVSIRMSNDERIKLESDIEKTKNRIISLRNSMEKTGDTADEMNVKMSDGFSKNTKTLQRFTFRLLNVASIYSVVSKASSAYLSTNEELANKLQSVWVGLGSFLAPAIEMISNALLKALGYLNVFVKALTGIDFIARANAKALKSQASAQKELNNQSYDFDVVRKQQDTSSSSGGGFGGGSGLIEIPELDENLVRKLQEMAGWLKENWYWIKEVGKVLLITFGAVKIGKVLTGIAGLLSGANGTGGLLKLSSVLKGLLTIGTITIGVDLLYKSLTGRDLIEDLGNIKKGIDEVKQSTKENTKADEQQTQGIKKLKNTLVEANQQNKLQGDLLKTTTNFLRNNTIATNNQIKEIENQSVITKEMREEEKALAEQMNEVTLIYGYLYQNQKLNEAEIYDYIDAIDGQIRIMKTLGQDTSHLEEIYKSLTGKTWEIKTSSNIEVIREKVLRALASIDKELDKNRTLEIATKSLNMAGNVFSGMFGFAKGGIVTQPTRALIGEAGYPEAVVPMTQDYLSTLASEIVKSGGNIGNGGTINVYLDGRLIQRQMNNRQQQIRFSTNS